MVQVSSIYACMCSCVLKRCTKHTKPHLKPVKYSPYVHDWHIQLQFCLNQLPLCYIYMENSCHILFYIQNTHRVQTKDAISRSGVWFQGKWINFFGGTGLDKRQMAMKRCCIIIHVSYHVISCLDTNMLGKLRIDTP